ncbi:type 1 glutamine amidotransferase [Variovorax soli]|uniref:GMP synthase-like glutamine amidotransferase n=1 Tax=Variovorax soli TaxID=376815 RepID=A0ABU1ND47_9BURK|nr:type 1 glutamine amidotransferase [Variovorax soli]MDR6536388.1 GMP synthase-like glutamine amidotransferase [Variovorax soli]
MRTRRPIAVFQHTEVGAPGAAVPILESLGCQVELIRIMDGDAVPPDASRFGGLVFMGGNMSAGDPLPWIAAELALIRDADRRRIPVAGHCLGSQIIAVALGGAVRTLERPEIGWCEITADASPTASEWWGEHAGQVLPTFQWHADTFQPPAGAVSLATGVHCRNQAFVLQGIHLLIQSHLEMTPALVQLAVERNGHQMLRQNALANPATSDYLEVLRDLPRRTQQMHGLLQRLYSRWLA